MSSLNSLQISQYAALLSNMPCCLQVMVCSEPGIGVFHATREHAEANGRKIYTISGASDDLADIQGLSVLKDGEVVKEDPVYLSADEPWVIFIDNIEHARPAMIEAIDDLVYQISQGTKPFHRDSRIILRSEQPMTAEMRFRMSNRLLSRLLHIEVVRPGKEEMPSSPE